METVKNAISKVNVDQVIVPGGWWLHEIHTRTAFVGTGHSRLLSRNSTTNGWLVDIVKKRLVEIGYHRKRKHKFGSFSRL